MIVHTYKTTINFQEVYMHVTVLQMKIMISYDKV